MNTFNRKSRTARAAQTAGTIAPRLKPLAGSIAAWAKYPGNWSFFVGALPAVALAQLPTGGAVVAGSATITTPDANQMVVQQSSNKAIYNWQSFSIGSNGYVQFVQPGGSSIALNRVVGGDPSSILGQLSSNGQIFLVNPNGVFFGANAVVDVAGIVATTMNIRDEDFMRGDYRFFRDPNTAPGATVINQGALNANGGYVVLAGDYVSNTGVIQAQLGTALLASGESLTMQLAGSTLINYAVDKATVAHLAGVSNAGQILANGGRVIMTADVANDLAATVVNNSGLIEAQSTVERNGAIYLEGNGGNVANSGTLDASAQAGANGGHVEVRASGDVHHEAGSLIKVSGADTGTSDAGSVYTWADGTNRFKGGASIIGKGGAEGGNGAAVELSGKAVQIAGDVNLRAAHGKGGSILLDPLNITIADQDSTPAGGSTVGEQWIEGQLQDGTDVTILADGGSGASITVANLSDGVLDGTNAETHDGGSLTLRASGAGSSITFVDKTDTIKVDRNLTLSADDGVMGSDDSYGHNGTTIDVGNLIAGQGNPTGGGLNNNATWESSLSLNAGSIQTRDLKLAGAIASDTNSVYNLTAHAHAGDLAITGDVTVDVSNTSAAGVKTNTILKADSGDVTVSGNVTSNAAGKGYYHYTWNTTKDGCAGANATSCYSTYADRSQPWKQVGEGDHAIGTTLAIQANSGNINIEGTTDARATDTNSDFAGNGGVWKTDTNTSKIFWRPAAPTAVAAINAGGNVDLGNTASVKADGYATVSYGETESWNDMIRERTLQDGVNHTYQVQQQNSEGDWEWVTKNDSENDVWNGSSYTGKFVWNQSWNTIQQGEQNHHVYHDSDSHSDSASTDMSYSGAAGAKATLELTAGGNVTLNGLDVTSTNRSATGSGSFSSAYWGHQDSSNVNAALPSAVREVDYSDSFKTSFNAATSTAKVDITAGDNGTAMLNGGDATYNVVSEHSALSGTSAVGNSLAHASMTITTGNGPVTLGGALNVSGASSNAVSLNMENGNGDVTATGSPISVTNAYNGGDGSATVQSNGNVHLDSVEVNGGRSAFLDVSAAGTLQIDGTSSATVTNAGSVGTADVQLSGVAGVSVGDVSASSTGMVNTHSSEDIYGYNQTINGGTASIDIGSTNGNVNLNGDVIASGYKTATVTATASGTGKTLITTADKTVSAITYGEPASSFPSFSHHSITVPTYTADVSLSANAGMTVDSNVAATVDNNNGAATVAFTTTGGTAAGITQGATSVIKTEGQSASVAINAGDAEPGAANAAAIDLNGGIQANSTSGSATIAINGKSGSVNAFSATSTGSTAVVNIIAYNGDLEVTGNESGTAAVSAAGNASANLETKAGTLTLGDASHGISVQTTGAGNSATLTAAGSADLVTNGALSAMGNAGNSTASVSLSSNAGDVALNNIVAAVGRSSATVGATSATGTLTQEKAVSATANAGNSSITYSSNGLTTINDDLVATATGTATVDVSGAGVTQAADKKIQATGVTAETTVDAKTGALVLGGMSRADVTTGTAGVTITGASGSVYDLSAISTGNIATGSVVTDTGALTLAHGATVTGYKENGTGAQLTLTGASNLDTSDATVAVKNDHDSDNAVANATLTASDGTNTLGAIMVSTAGKGTAELEAKATGDLSTVGELTAKGHQFTGDDPQTSGNATVKLSSSSGNVNLANNVTAKGNTNATVSVTADTGDVTQTAGTVLAQIDRGHEAKVEFLSGGKMTVDATVQSIATNGSATVGLNSSAAPTEGDALVIAGNIGADSLDGNASVLVNTTGGDQASIALEASGSIGAAGGTSSTITILAGTDDADAMNAGNAAAFKVAGRLSAGLDDADPQFYRGGTAQVTVAGKSGSVSQFTVFSGDTANVNITAHNGDLTLGAVDVIGQGEAKLTASASGELTATGRLSAELESTISLMGCFSSCEPEPGLAQIDLTSTAGKVVTNGGSELKADGGSSGNAEILVAGETGIDLNGTLTATGTNGTARIDLTSWGNIALNNNMTALGSSQADVSVNTYDDGALTQKAGTTTRAGATDGSATVDFTTAGAMTVNGNIVAAATSDGTVDGEHTGQANVYLWTTGAASDITQGANSVVTGMGSSANMTVVAGKQRYAGFLPPSDPAAAFKLNGTLNVLDDAGGSTLEISGASGSVHDFTVVAENAPASATITTYNGGLTFTGNGEVTSATDATLTAKANGDLILASNTNLSAKLSVGDSSTPFPFFMAMTSDPNLAQVNLESVTGKVVTGAGSALSATADGSSNAEVNVTSLTGIQVGGQIASSAAEGSATVKLKTTADTVASSITQAVGTTISAHSTGESGDALVDIQAGNCCQANAMLNGSVEAMVDGAGDATIGMRGNNVVVKNAKANVLGSGDALLDIAAPTSIAVTGTIDVQAANAESRADVKLISDKLTYSGGRAIMSKGNSYAQLASFDTRRVTGVYSDNDFDATVQTNYGLATLQKFMGNQTELRFGGEYDRSAWTKESDPLEFCLPGMANWASTLQQTADIHVAANGRLNLGDVKMVFDTTGTTYYHDNQMSPWSVPSGRIAVFVARPGNIDRYLDRTDNTLQTMTEAIEDAPANTGLDSGAPMPGATLIQGNLFMDGDGVNTGMQVASASGTGSPTGAPGGTNAGNGTGAADNGAANAGQNSGNDASPSNGNADNDGKADDSEEQRRARGNRN